MPVCARCLRQPLPLEAEFYCASCRTPFLNRFPLDAEGRCGLCRTGLRGFDGAYCFGSYEGPLRELIHLYKYGRVETLGKPLAELLARALPVEEPFDAVIPVPLHWRKQWQRGFNQAGLLAKEIARRRAIPVVPALARTRYTLTQAGLSNTERRRNVAAAFRCRASAAHLAGKRVLLIDDVMTTGSTAAACARVLKQAGAARVVLATVARVDRRWEGAGTQRVSSGRDTLS